MANNSLPHYRNSTASNNNFEPVVGSQFQCYLMPPSGVSDATILTEHVRSVSDSFFTEYQGNVLEQNGFQTTQRRYDSNQKQNGGTFQIVFSLNLDDSNDNYVYRIIREWFRKKWDPTTGTRGLKKDYIGQITVVKYNRDGSIYQQRTASFCFPSGDLQGLEANYGSNDPQELTVEFTADIIEDDAED